MTIFIKRIETIERDFVTERNSCSEQGQSGAGILSYFPKPAVDKRKKRTIIIFSGEDV